MDGGRCGKPPPTFPTNRGKLLKTHGSKMAVYLNTYEVYQAYGGPEEGGWWYDCGTPVQSVLLSNEEYEEWTDQHPSEYLSDLREKAVLAFSHGLTPTPQKTGYGGYTFAPGSDIPLTYQEDNNYVAVIEDCFAQPYPTTIPHYE